MGKRKPIPKGVRFEVFKRDKFTCQYCGKSAPDVVLEVDHIEPVSKGGTNDILNLVTSCNPCNAGKGARRLDDQSAVAKARRQMEELQERREQLEMLMEWRRGLRSIQRETVEALAEEWNSHTPGRCLNARGMDSIRKLCKQFSAAELLEAMEVAADQYLELDGSGSVTPESFEVAFGKIGGICHNRRQDDYDVIQQAIYIRGILRRRYDLNARAYAWALDLVKMALKGGAPFDVLKRVAQESESWSEFIDYADSYVEEED